MGRSSRAMPRTNAPGMVLKGGTLTSWQAPGAVSLVQLLAAGTWDGSRMVCLGTLLGPEGPGGNTWLLGLPAGAAVLVAEAPSPRRGTDRPSNGLGNPVRDARGSDPARTLRTA